VKLVDILARELKEWPAECTSQRCCQSDQDTWVFFGGRAKSIKLSRRASRTEDVFVTRAQWQAAVDALKAREKAWDGKGLPPVGSVCEYNWRGEWCQCEVIAHKDGLAICWINCNKILSTSGAAVRPIRTAEQVEYDKKAKWVREAISCLSERAKVRPVEAGIILSELYDAGYRKQDQSK